MLAGDQSQQAAATTECRHLLAGGDTSQHWLAKDQDSEAQIKQATQDREGRSETKEKKLQAKADDNGNLKDITITKQVEEKYIADLVATCEQKASDFESRQQLRSEKFEAITEVIEIIGSDAVREDADTYLLKLVQRSSTALAQLRAPTSVSQQRVAEYLRGRAHDLDSKVLFALAVRAADDPFSKVKMMIKDSIEWQNQHSDRKQKAILKATEATAQRLMLHGEPSGDLPTVASHSTRDGRSSQECMPAESPLARVASRHLLAKGVGFFSAAFAVEAKLTEAESRVKRFASCRLPPPLNYRPAASA